MLNEYARHESSLKKSTVHYRFFVVVEVHWNFLHTPHSRLYLTPNKEKMGKKKNFPSMANERKCFNEMRKSDCNVKNFYNGTLEKITEWIFINGKRVECQTQWKAFIFCSIHASNYPILQFISNCRKTFYFDNLYLLNNTRSEKPFI